MYIWQWCFGSSVVVVGRTWTEFIWFVDELLKNITTKDTKLCVFVHNLSYEFQFLSGIYDFKAEDVFAIKSRKVLKCLMHDKIEFKCSYIHSNMSLDEYTKKMGASHLKLSGDEFDYTKERYPWTELTQREMEYCVNDVIGLVEAITNEMKHDGDNLYSFPLTSTGYVRRDAKQAMKKIPTAYVKSQLPDYDVFCMLREAFRGGDTHANRFFAGQILNDVHSADRSSSYPDVICNCEFPVSAFYHVGDISTEEVLDLMTRRHKAVLFRASFTNIRLKRMDWGCPYLARAKCQRIEEAAFDNGRILNADYLETTLTDIDFRIILDQYEFDDCRPYDVCYARYGKLPESYLAEVRKYYVAKTELKGVDGQEVYYMKSKNKLNSLYGMMAQIPVKQTIDYIDGEFIERCEDETELLEKHNKKAFLCYQWGCWVTAWARYRLQEGIKLAHEEGALFVYCDTDSVKYLGTIDWDKYNKVRIKDSKKSKAYATDPSGETHYMGVYEQEHDMVEFCTMGAKKYCYRETYSKPLQITVAGVSKGKGGKELEKHGGISSFKEGFIFTEAGGLEAIYNDNPEISTYEVDGRSIKITKNVCLVESTYTLGLTADYARLIEQCQWGELEFGYSPQRDNKYII